MNEVPMTPTTEIAARAWVLIDQASGRQLASHQADLPLAPSWRGAIRAWAASKPC